MLCARIGSSDGLELIITELGFSDGKIIGTALGDMDGLEISINEVTELGLWNGRVLGTTLGTYDGSAVGSLD